MLLPRSDDYDARAVPDPDEEAPFLLRTRTITALASAALLLGACGDDDDDGGGGSVSASDYATDICTAFLGWRDDIQARQQDLQQGLSPGISPQEGKDALAGFLGDAVDASDDLVKEVEAAGVPDAENGQEAADALQGAAQSARDELAKAEEAVGDLPTDDRQAFSTAADELGNNVRTALGEVGSGLEDIESEELDKAFDEEEACQG
jgi:hypothetical protein